MPISRACGPGSVDCRVSPPILPKTSMERPPFTACRAGGETVRSLTDCLIASAAIRTAVPILHSDRDFDVIARHTTLQVLPLDP
jgi:hypothetical protein